MIRNVGGLIDSDVEVINDQHREAIASVEPGGGIDNRLAEDQQSTFTFA